MFGLKKFNNTKTKRFESNKKRKQYFAIQSYYKKKGTATKTEKAKKEDRPIF